MSSLSGNEQVSVLPQTARGGPSPEPEITTTQAIANLGGGGGATGATGPAGATGATGPTGSGTTATATLSSAQILACAATPVVVVPAPGSGKTIVLLNAVFVYDFLTAAYGGGSFSGLYYGANTNTAVLQDQGVLGGTQNSVSYGPPNYGTNNTSAVSGLGIYYTAQSSFTTGSGTLTIIASYMVVSSS